LTSLSKAKKKAPTKFKEAAGKTLAVDVSMWLHQSCSLEETAFCFHAHPRYPPSKVLAEVKQCHQLMTQDGIKLHSVFDGSANPMKKETMEAQQGKRRDTKSWLKIFYVTNLERRSFERKESHESI
jgi:5'-3' exonuclease